MILVILFVFFKVTEGMVEMVYKQVAVVEHFFNIIYRCSVLSINSRRFPWEKDCAQIIISVKKEVVKNCYFSVFTWSLWGRPSCGAEQEDIAAKRGLIGR